MCYNRTVKKVEFHPLVYQSYGYSFIGSEHSQIRDPDKLRNLYISCLRLERRNPNQNAEELCQARENLASNLIQMYLESDSLNAFSRELSYLLSTSESLSEINDMPSNTRETLRATVRNLQTASWIADEAEQYVSGVLLSGSNAWGPFYAVRGNIQGRLPLGEDLNPKKKEPSDLDILINFNNLEDLQDLINGFNKKGLLSDNEKSRFLAFQRLYPDSLDMLSSRTTYNDTQISLHFVPPKLLSRMANPKRGIKKSGKELDFALDFRPNTPWNTEKGKGYPIYGIKGGKPVYFRPEIQSLEIEGKKLGYISKTPLGGFLPEKRQPTYFIGILSFFLLVSPAILVDKEEKLIEAHRQLLDNIRMSMNGTPANYIVREDEMNNNFRKAFKEYLK